MKEQKASCLFYIVISMGLACEFKVIDCVKSWVLKFYLTWPEKFGDVTLEIFF